MKHWNRRKPIKVLCFILTVPLLAAIVLSIVGATFMWDYGWYYKNEYEVMQEVLQQQYCADSNNIMHEICYALDAGDPIAISSRYTDSDRTNLRFELLDKNGKVLHSTLPEHMKDELYSAGAMTFYFQLERYEYGNGLYHVHPQMLDGDAPLIQQIAQYQIRCYLDTALAAKDNYWMAWLVGFAFDMQTAVFYVMGIALALLIFCFVNLTLTAGRRPNTQELHPGKLDQLPTDVLLMGCVVCMGIWLALLDSLWWNLGDVFSIILMIFCIMASIYFLLGLWLCLASRFKRGQLLRNTLVWKLCRLLWRGVRGTKSLVMQLPMIWRTGLLALGLFVWNFLMLVFCGGRYLFFGILMFFLEAIAVTFALLWSAIYLRKLQAAGQALADGNLGYKLDTTGMFGDLKTHGENLNSIALGMSRAVQEQVKSQRLRTELITNVSHDIKNPLTSIINYAGLIAQEPCDNEKHAEYADVLSRKSEHLKRLLEDLVEVSKATTGNMDVDLAPCQAGVLLQQLAGEFSDRCQVAELLLVVKQPEEPISIQVDSRRIWRVFENLMGNACKYSLPGSRVYLSLEKRGDAAVFTFRNTSREPLDISPEELMERFVRGDSARSTEGNGLGLSIAQSLTQVQGGTMDLEIDGDLFKVTLTFPIA